MKTYLFDISMTLLAIGLFATLFYQLGRGVEERKAQIEERLTEREIQDLTEMRVMREWELERLKGN